MVKHLKWLLTLHYLLYFSISGQTVSVDQASDSLIMDSGPVVGSESGNTNNVPPEYPFQLGEKLEFEIKYGFIKAGDATMEVVDTVTYLGRKSILIQTTAKSRSSFDMFFKVRDTVQSYVDWHRFISLSFIKKLREGGYFYDLYSQYVPDENRVNVVWVRYHDENFRVKKQGSLELSIPDETYDVLASLYKIRMLDLNVDSSVFITNHDNRKIYDLKVEVLKREVVKVPAGKFLCLKLEPKLKGEAIFKQKGRLWVWVTDDEYKIPVKMSSKVAVGSISTVLKRMKNVPEYLPSKIK
ncbi:MAG: DUF3108 domain-containing protein [Calditrichia bacterium]